MKKTIVTRVLTIATAAVMLAGAFTAGVTAPVIKVEAADASFAQSLWGAFDAGFYASKYPDVKKAYGTNADALFTHFVNNGMREGRMINANFDPKAYIDAYSDVKAHCKGDYVKAYEHYYKYGKNEGRTLTTYAAINASKAAKAPKATTQKPTVTYRSVNIGNGLSVALTDDQLRNCSIVVMTNDFGYGAYLNGILLATSGNYYEYGAYHYSTVYFNNYNMSESIQASYYYQDDEELKDALMLALFLASLSDEEED